MQTSLKNPAFTALGVRPPNPSQTRFRNVIFCARKRRQQPRLNRKVSKLILDAALTVASNLNVVPPPVTALIREFGVGGGSGGGFGSPKGGGDGGFGWWRRRARSLGLFVLLVVVIGMGLCAGRKVRNDVVLCGFGLAAFGGLIGSVDVRTGDWILGFCSCAGIVGLLALRVEEVSKMVEKVRVSFTELGIMKLRLRGFKSRPFQRKSIMFFFASMKSFAALIHVIYLILS